MSELQANDILLSLSNDFLPMLINSNELISKIQFSDDYSLPDGTTIQLPQTEKISKIKKLLKSPKLNFNSGHILEFESIKDNNFAFNPSKRGKFIFKNGETY